MSADKSPFLSIGPASIKCPWFLMLQLPRFGMEFAAVWYTAANHRKDLILIKQVGDILRDDTDVKLDKIISAHADARQEFLERLVVTHNPSVFIRQKDEDLYARVDAHKPSAYSLRYMWAFPVGFSVCTTCSNNFRTK